MHATPGGGPSGEHPAGAPTLFLMVGLPGAGKTTVARQLEVQRGALRLSPDEWLIPLFGADEHPSPAQRETVEALQWAVAARALALGLSVVLENGFWRRDERQDLRRKAAELGARCELVYLDVPRAELWARLERRNRERPPGTFTVAAADLDTWLGWFEPPDDAELGSSGG